MPVLPIADEEGNLAEDAGHQILGVMTYPKDLERRVRNRTVVDSWTLVQHAREHDQSNLSLPTETVATLVTSPSLEKQQEATLKEFIYGQYAGWILGLVVICSENLPQHASVSKAVEALENVVLEGAKMPGGGDAPRSRTFLLRQWKRFQSVAHLYAAYEAIAGGGELITIQEVLMDNSLILHLLGAAVQYQSRASKVTVQKGSRFEPLVDPGALWTVPPTIQLPEVELGSARIPDEVQQAFKKYRAPKKF